MIFIDELFRYFCVLSFLLCSKYKDYKNLDQGILGDSQILLLQLIPPSYSYHFASLRVYNIQNIIILRVVYMYFCCDSLMPGRGVIHLCEKERFEPERSLFPLWCTAFGNPREYKTFNNVEVVLPLKCRTSKRTQGEVKSHSSLS
jgi:hypothetical protein